jgi:hypothetical protein
MHISNERLELPIVVINGVKKLEESLNDLDVRFSKILIQVDQIDIILNLRVDQVHILQVVKVK